MSNEPLDLLLDRLANGDAAAAEHIFVTYEPYLRIVVRRQIPHKLQAKFDSVDIVQSVWADLLQTFRDSGYRFADAAHLRAFLVKVTRNRFIDGYRHHRLAVQREQSLETIKADHLSPTVSPRPSEMAQAEELWQQMLDLCPESHREVLRMKRQGAALAEIAARTGLHPSSVRRILYDLARRLAAKQHEASPPAPAHPK